MPRLHSWRDQSRSEAHDVALGSTLPHRSSFFFTPLSMAALFIHHLILYILKRVSITATAGKLVNILARYGPAYG